MLRQGPKRTLITLALALSVASLSPAEAGQGSTKVVSRNGSTAANGHTPARSVPDVTSPDMSLDGSTIAFSSDASNLVSGDTNGVSDIFVKGAVKGRPIRVSTAQDGTQANGASYSPALTVDGKKIAFVSRATNLVKGDTNGKADVFFKDLVTGSIYIVSRAGSTQSNGDSNNPFMSLFGDWITFESDATNLSSGDTNGLSDAFLHTRKGRTLRRIVPVDTAEDDGIIDGVAHTGSATISHDGKTLAYERIVVRTDPELPPQANVCAETPQIPVSGGPPKGHDACPLAVPFAADVFIETPKKTQRIAMKPWGSSSGAAKRMLENPRVTADGRYVAYEAWSAVTPAETGQLRPRVPPELEDVDPLHAIEELEDHSGLVRNPYDQRTVYVFDHKTKVFWPVSTNLAGPYSDGDCYDASPNAYGTVIAFTCDASNMVAGDTNDAPDVFVKDMPARATSRMSMSATQGEGFGISNRPSISYDGRRVAFASSVATFVSGDSNSKDDVFLRDRQTETPNQPPVLLQPFDKPIGIDPLESISFRLRATDLDKDILRFGTIIGLPDGAHVDPVTGVFSWLPGPEHSEPGGRRYDIVFWVGDPRGTYSLDSVKLVTLVVRDPAGTARCRVFESNCDPVL